MALIKFLCAKTGFFLSAFFFFDKFKFEVRRTVFLSGHFSENLLKQSVYVHSAVTDGSINMQIQPEINIIEVSMSLYVLLHLSVLYTDANIACFQSN